MQKRLDVNYKTTRYAAKMIGISALTEFSSDESEDEPLAEATKEAKESEAFALYNKALLEQRSNNHDDAEALYHSLLQSRFLEEVEVPDEGSPLVDPAAMLKYSAYKNLGNLALLRDDQKQAVEYLLEAVCLDSTDVSVWYRIGQVAVELIHLPLAHFSFREGLRCNPNHWPSLTSIITVLYAISDYSSCLSFVAKILEKDSKHAKAHAFRTQILKEDAYSRKHADVIFKKCSDSVHHYRTKKEDVSKFVDEAVKLREERRKLAEVPPLPVLKFQSSFKDFRWKHLGDQLIQLYDYVDSCEPPISFGCRVDLSPCWLKEKGSSGSAVEKAAPSFATPSGPLEDSAHPSQELKPDGDTVAWTEQSDGGVSGMETDELSERQTDGEGVAVSNANRGGIIGSSDSQIQTTDVSGTETEEAPEKSRKSHKKKRGLMSEPAPGKRRSARVRNTEKKKEVRESINYQELLLRFLPSTLLQSNQEEPVDIFESPSAQPQRQSANTKDLPDLPVTSDLAEGEAEAVEEFLKSHQENGGVVCLMEDYLMCLSKQFLLRWPRKLYSVYVEVYKRMRKHITIPALFFKDQTDGYKRNLGLVILVYMEISVDRGRVSKTQERRFGDFFQQDMFYLEDLGVMESIMKEYLPDFAVRVYWMRAHNFAGEGKTAVAVHAYDVCHELLTTSDLNEKIIHLPNIIQDKIITKEIVESKKDSLRRTQSHEEILKLFEGGNYERVVDILRPVVDTPRSDGDDVEKLKQRLMLVEALLKVKDHKNVVICFHKILKELWEDVQGLDDFQAKVAVMETVDKFFELLVGPLSEFPLFLRDTYHSAIVQLTHLQIELISWSMENFEVTVEGVLAPTGPTVHPWILLYHIIKSEEQKLEEKKIPSGMETDTMETDDRSNSPVPLLPSSIMLLDTAHEYLGRKSWCCNSSGALLKLTADVLSGELEKIPEETHPFSEDIQQSLEQCFYCLYGHPHKRTKAKHLQDHGVEEVPLTWSYGKCMFAYFKPKMLPEFDGYKTSSMSGDLENLFLRITKVIPSGQRPEDSVEKIHAYIDGGSDDVPTLSAGVSPNSPVVTEIFYLLADYYFKNKEFGKANRFYINDICFCPNRLDSWAGLALAKSGRLELKLNSCDAKAEGGVYKQGMGSLRCFHRALEIDQSNRSLWIEYGSFAYILQSHASRQLKQQEQIQLSDESVEGLKIKQAEMLTLAEECFRKVNQMGGDEEGEEWLIHYMLGKISEKRGEMNVALRHYLEAMEHLHSDGAKFPKKISYHNPPDLALESVEMYFRIHAAVLKNLKKNQSEIEKIDFQPFEEIIHLASIQPFVKRLENKLSEISSEHSTDAEQDGVKLALPPVLHSSRSNSPRYFTAPQDHDYARRMYRKSRGSSQEEVPTDTASEGDIQSGEESAQGSDLDSQRSALVERHPSVMQDAPAPSSETRGKTEAADKKPETAVVPEMEKTEEPVPMDTKEKEKEKEASVAGPQTEELSAAERFKRLVEQSISAMHLCLQRFPQHYKSLYRIAHWHLTSATEKNLQWCRDLLLGSALPWQQTSHMPSPALFGEHNKTKNIFQGIWRIPIADIDRSGSFSWHMYRSVTLLIDVLEELKDEAMLLQLATKLARTPEQGKKFLRDSDRPHLATRAYQTCQKLLAEETGKVSSLTETEKFNLLMKIWQTLSVGQQLHHAGDSKVASKSLTAVYKSYKGKEIEDEPSVYDQASRFCQNVVNTSKLPQTPTQGDYHRFVRPGHLGSPVKAPSSPGPGKSSEKVNQPTTSDKGPPPQRSITTASQGPASQVKKSPEVPLGSSFLMSSILAPDTERKKSNQGMRTVPYLDERGVMATKGDTYPHPQQDEQSKPKSAGHAIAREVTSTASATFGASGGAVMSSQERTEKSLGDDKTRGESQPNRLEKERDFSGESSSILGDASQKGVGDAQPPSKTEESSGQVKSVSNPDRPIGESDPEEPRIGIFESLALPKRDFLEPTKRVVPSLDGRDKDGKGSKAKPAGVSYPKSSQEESKFKLKDESKVAVADEKETKQSSGGIVKHRPVKIPHLVENKSELGAAKQGLPDQSQVVKGTTGDGGHLGKASITDSGLGLGQYQDSSLGFGQDSNSKLVPDLGQHLSSLLQRVRAGVNVSNKTKWRRLSSSSSPGGESSNKSKSAMTDVKGKDEDRGHTIGDIIPPKSSSKDIPKPQESLIQKEDPGFKGAGVVAISFGESATDVRKEKSSDKWEHLGDEKNQSQKSEMSWFDRKERENALQRESGSGKWKVELIQKEDPGFKGAGVVAVSFGESATDVRKEKSSDKWEYSGDEKNQSQKNKMSWFDRKERENDLRRESGSAHETDGQGTSSLKLHMATVQGGFCDTKSVETGESSTLGRKLDEPRRLETGEKRKLSYPEILDSLKRKRFDFSGIKKKLASRQHLRTSQEALTQDKRKKVKVEDNRAPAIDSKLGSPSTSVSRPERGPLLELPTTSVSRPERGPLLELPTTSVSRPERDPLLDLPTTSVSRPERDPLIGERSEEEGTGSSPSVDASLTRFVKGNFYSKQGGNELEKEANDAE